MTATHHQNGGLGNAASSASTLSAPPFAAPAPASAPPPPPPLPAPTALTAPQVDSYMGELLSYSLERLQSEPRVLAEEAARLERHAQQVAVHNHRAFIDGSDALAAAQASLRQSIAQLDELLAGGVAGLSGACEQFAQTAAHTIAAGAANKALLASQSTLLDLLEAPSLAASCVRGGAYDEALDLQAFVARLAMLHPELLVARALKRRMDDVNAQMLASLLGRLRSSSLTLPECLRLVGYLRRAPRGTFGGEAELRLRFLRCRDDWLAGLVRDLEMKMETASAASTAGVGAGGEAGGGAGGAGGGGGGGGGGGNTCNHEPFGGRAAEYVKRLIDLHRLHLFDIVMQYRAVFSDAAVGPSSSSPLSRLGGPGAAAGADAATATAAAAAATRAGAVLPSWLAYRVGEFVDSLAAALPHVSDGASLASTMEHCAYAGASLGRVGADCTAQLAPVFEACSLRLFGAYLGAAGDAFRARLESHRWIALSSSSGSASASAAAAALASSRQKAAAMAAAAGGVRAETNEPSDAGAAGDVLVPPAALMEHPPVAVYVNGVLAALNEHRHCATWSSKGLCGKALQSSLDGAALAMVSFSHSHPLPPGELQQFRAAARMLGDVAAPFLVQCFARVFATSVASSWADKVEVGSLRAVLTEVLEG